MGLGSWWRNRKLRIWIRIMQLYLNELQALGGPDAPPLSNPPTENFYAQIAAAKTVYPKTTEALLFAQEALSDLQKASDLREKIAAILTNYLEVVSSFHALTGVKTSVYIYAALRKNTQIEELMKKIDYQFYRCPLE